MDFSNAQYAQLIIGLGFAVVFFVICYGMPKVPIAQFLIIIAPFQVLDTKYGSINTALVVIFGLSIFLNNRISKRSTKPYHYVLFGIAVVLFAYALCFVYNRQPMFILKAAYVFNVSASFVFFYSIYHVTNTAAELDRLTRALVVSNILVVGYCLILLAVGFGEFVPFGIEEFAFHTNREDNRLLGPFTSPETMSDYFVLLNILLGFLIMRKKLSRRYLLLIFLNLSCLMGTGSRGGAVGMVLATVLLAFVFRKELNFAALLKYLPLLVLIAVAASFVMIRFTDFNVMFERLAGTEFEGVTPDSRGAWPEFIENITGDEWIFGHGVRIPLAGDFVEAPSLEKQMEPGQVFAYPHSLPLYLLYSMGLIGFAAYGVFFSLLMYAIRIGRKLCAGNDYLVDYNRMAFVFMGAFLFSQLRIEYLRHLFFDYQQILFAFFALAIATSKVAKNEIRGRGCERRTGSEPSAQLGLGARDTFSVVDRRVA